MRNTSIVHAAFLYQDLKSATNIKISNMHAPSFFSSPCFNSKKITKTTTTKGQNQIKLVWRTGKVEIRRCLPRFRARSQLSISMQSSVISHTSALLPLLLLKNVNMREGGNIISEGY